MALSDDSAQLDVLFADFLTSLAAYDAANTALQGAVANVGTSRDDVIAKRNAMQAAYNVFQRRIGTASMTAQQRQAFKRAFGDLDDLSPLQLAGAVRRAAEGGG